MECYSEQTCTIFVDGELTVDEARRLRDHLARCQRCRKLVDALRAENRVLGESLHELPEEAAGPVGFPRLRLSWVWGDLAALAAVLALVSIFFAWVDKLRIPEALEWLNPFSANGLTNLIFNLSYNFAHGGTVMLRCWAAAHCCWDADGGYTRRVSTCWSCCLRCPCPALPWSGVTVSLSPWQRTRLWTTPF